MLGFLRRLFQSRARRVNVALVLLFDRDEHFYEDHRGVSWRRVNDQLSVLQVVTDEGRVVTYHPSSVKMVLEDKVPEDEVGAFEVWAEEYQSG